MTSATCNTATESSVDAFVVSAHKGHVEIIDPLAEEWRTLCAEAVDDQIFYRPEFIQAHIRTTIPEAKLVIITVRQEGRLRLLLPLVEERSTFSKIPVRRLRAPANVNCGRFDAVRSAGPEGEAAILAVWRYLKQMDSWDVLQLRYSLSGSTTSRLVSVAEAEGFLAIHQSDRPNPYVPVPSDPALLERMPRSSRLRTKLRQIRRQIAERGGLRFYCVERADATELGRLFALEESGWKGRGGTAVNNQPAYRRFFYELAESAASFGYLCLYMMELDGELIAAHFSLRYRDRCHSPIVAFNEDYKHLAPGHLIVSEILRDCASHGIAGFDITGQDQEWKMKWTSEALEINDHFIFKGPIGRLAYGAGVQLKSALKRLITQRNSVAK